MKRNQQIDKHIDAALGLYAAEAKSREYDAGCAGQMSDGGCSRMLGEIDAYNCGRKGTIPKWLEPYMTKVVRQNDPEYETYLRLQKKFGK